MRDIQFTKEALFDIEAAVLWYEEQRTGLSYDFELCLEAGIDAILRNPEAFQKKYKDIKIRFISRFPYSYCCFSHLSLSKKLVKKTWFIS